LTEIEFDLPAEQYELMGCPGLQQGHSLNLQLESAMLLPDPGTDGWYSVQKEKLPETLRQVGRALYAFSGQIRAAELVKEEAENGAGGIESATLLVQCGEAPLRVLCAPHADGRLPFGTWETRYLAGYGRIVGVVEEDFSTGVGERVSVTIWGFRRLVLAPGDPLFGIWHEADTLPPAPFHYDRVLVTARLHRAR
jgi:hypothetical protein